MNSITLSNPITDALGWTLLHAVWQGFALVLPVAILLHVLRNRSSALRYQIGVAGLLAQVLASVVTFGWLYKPAATVSAMAMTGVVQQVVPANWQPVSQTLPLFMQVQQFLTAHLNEFVVVYLVGVLLFALRLAGGWLYLQRLSRTATLPASKQVAVLTESLREAMQLRPVVHLRESARVAVPMVVGVLKPILLLPIGLVTNLSLAELEAVLAHELAHVKRHDYAVNLLQSVMEVLYFFHPALWWLSARVREEREHCCDDLAIKTIGGNGRTLATALAHVEEIRLAQRPSPSLTTPALAMALTSKRQLLLHRVQRVLGVPTRPFVSNGSLAGLTLATLLLLSASVYAVQQQLPSKPKAAQPKPLSTQRFNGVTSGKRIGYNLLGGRLTTIDVNGKRLPKTRVDQIQKQLDQVVAGQLNLDDVAQPNRDIMLTIFEKSAGLDIGMKALSEGFSHIDYGVGGLNEGLNASLNADLNEKGSAQIDYNAIMKTAFDAANAAGTFPVSVDDVLNEVKGIDYNRIIQGTIVRIDTSITGVASVVTTTTTRSNTADTERDRQREFHQQKMDSLSQLIAQRSQQTQTLHLDMEKYRFPVDELNRQNDVLNWRKDKLIEQRNALTNKHQQLLQNSGKQKLTQTEIEKQLVALEPEIKKTEESMVDLNRQMEASNAKQDELKKPIEKLEQRIEELQRQIEKLSEQIGRHGDAVVGLIPMDPMVSTKHELRPPTSPRSPARPPRPPKPPFPRVAPYKVIDGVVIPMKPIAPARPKVSVAPPTPKVTPVPKPAPATAPIPPR